MCDDSRHQHDTDNNHKFGSDRRNFLKTSAAVTIGMGMMQSGMAWANKDAPVKKGEPAKATAKTAPKPENVLTPDQALERLMEGNKRYVEGAADHPVHFHDVEKALIGGQNPYATILACADSRVSPEHCFDESLGDLFVVRTAGNYLTSHIVASIEYAVAVLKTPLIMVVGHESCGAVKAAIEAVDTHKDFPGHIQLMASAIAPAVRAVHDTSSSRLLNVTKANVIQNVERLRVKTPVIDAYHDEKKIRIVGGIYHLKTGVVEIIA